MKDSGYALVLLFAVTFAGTDKARLQAQVPVAKTQIGSRLAPPSDFKDKDSLQYKQLQHRLAQGWNTWDVRSVTTHVLLPEGLAIHIGVEHNSTELVDSFLPEILIGKLGKSAEQVQAGPHTWDGSYTDLSFSWRGNAVRIQSAQDGPDLVLLATPLPMPPKSVLPPTLIFSVDYLWNRPGAAQRTLTGIQARSPSRTVEIHCTTALDEAGKNPVKRNNSCMDTVSGIPVASPYFAVDFRTPVGLSTGRNRTLAEINAIIEHQRSSYETSIARAGKSAPLVDAIETTIGWNTNYDPENRRVITPVSRGWSTGWGGYVLFDWDTFFAASLAAVGSRDLAYANAIEILKSETPAGFVPNFARGGGWKSFDRSEPPVGAITVLALYQKFHDRWFLEQAYAPLLRWNRWWSQHRDIQGYLSWGSDAQNQPANLDDTSIGKRDGAVLESGLDNSPMYDGVTYSEQAHQLEFADVGLMSLYIADCDALAQIADALGKTSEATELHNRSQRYRSSLATLWNEKEGIFLNKDLHTGESSTRLSPTNFYPFIAQAATSSQARRMIDEHLLNPDEFWGERVIPSIARDDPAFKDQKYWRGRIWGPLNYLVYLGLRNYANRALCDDFAQKSANLFNQEWAKNHHVHENYNAITGMGDDVDSSDRFYHWGALLALIQYDEQTQPPSSTPAQR